MRRAGRIRQGRRARRDRPCGRRYGITRQQRHCDTRQQRQRKGSSHAITLPDHLFTVQRRMTIPDFAAARIKKRRAVLAGLQAMRYDFPPKKTISLLKDQYNQICAFRVFHRQTSWH
jgi:hypothetical protein